MLSNDLRQLSSRIFNFFTENSWQKTLLPYIYIPFRKKSVLLNISLAPFICKSLFILGRSRLYEIRESAYQSVQKAH